MATRQKVLIVDDDNNIAELISLYFTKECFETMIVNDGESVMEAVTSFEPNLIMLDLMLPGCDGITILEALHKMDNRPVVLAISRIFGYYIQDSLERLGVSYAMQKPCDVELVANRLIELAKYPKNRLLGVPAAENTIRGILSELGLSGKHMGYHCLIEAIYLIAKNPRQQFEVNPFC